MDNYSIGDVYDLTCRSFELANHNVVSTWYDQGCKEREGLKKGIF